jgi:hypothetical protein
MITTTSLPDAVEGTHYKATLTASGGTLPYKFSIIRGSLPTGLSMSTHGAISGTPSGAAGTSSNSTVQVTDSSNPALTATANLSITVYSRLAITTTVLPPASYFLPYSATVRASGKPSYSFSVISGSLPFGLAMNTSGAIFGTADDSIGTYKFTVQVTDSSNPVQTATQRLSILVVGPPTMTTVSLPNGRVGIPYHKQLMVTGGTPPYTWSLYAGLMPPGLSLSTSGLISGTPTTADSYNLPVVVDDSSNPIQGDLRFFIMTISP